ncbi:MAG: YfhO family protein [Acidobacteriota bacterium]|nr:YfhO family protein [Acidobacteriota bacterium]
MTTKRPTRARPTAGAQVLRETAAVGWLVLVAGVFLTPALLHGHSLGPYDVLSQFGLTNDPHVAVHNFVNSDEIEEFIPWQALAWLQVHAGHLPLWDPHSMLGLPLAFNFQALPFGPTVAIGYLFSLSWAHSATIIARLIIGGGGAYFLARVLKLDILPALLCATIFELSGGFTAWLGDYEAGCMAWSGWVLACSVLVVRGRHRAWATGGLTLALTFAFLDGEPQIASVLVGIVALVAVVMLATTWRSRGARAAWAGALDHAVALVAAAFLVAPVYLPSIQLALASARNVGPPMTNLPLHDLTHLLFASYNGVPTSMATIIGPNNLYVSMIYVGPIALVLIAASFALWRQRSEVVAFTLAASGLLVLLFAGALVPLFRRVPLLDVFRVQLATTALELCLAVLAGFGAQALVERRGERLVENWYRVGVALCVLVVLVLGVLLARNVSHLAAPEWRVRARSFVWPGVGLAICTVVLVTRWRTDRRPVPLSEARAERRRRRLARAGLLELAALLVVETTFLVSSGAGIISSSPGFLPTNDAVTTLQRLVGTSLVGFGSCAPNAFPSTGLVPDVNIAYGVSEFASYDPILPRSYHTSYGRASGTSAALIPPYGLYCPQIDSVRLARLYGVAFILEPPGTPGPPGTRRVATLVGEGLYAVPGSGRATLVALGNKGPSVVQPSSQPSPSSWRVDVSATRPSMLQLRISNVPGWQAQIDGRPLKLRPFDYAMLEARVPSGHHVVTLTYRPRAWSSGLVLAATTMVVLMAALAVVAARTRRRGQRRSSTSSDGSSPRGVATGVDVTPRTPQEFGLR